jgi:hypothetical protein
VTSATAALDAFRFASPQTTGGGDGPRVQSKLSATSTPFLYRVRKHEGGRRKCGERRSVVPTEQMYECWFSCLVMRLSPRIAVQARGAVPRRAELHGCEWAGRREGTTGTRHDFGSLVFVSRLPLSEWVGRCLDPVSHTGTPKGAHARYAQYGGRGRPFWSPSFRHAHSVDELSNPRRIGSPSRLSDL